MNNTDVIIAMGFRDLIFCYQKYVFIVNKTVLEVKMLSRLLYVLTKTMICLSKY